MTKHFNTNETLELCDVRVSQNGTIEVETKNYNREAMDRLGVPGKVCRGRIKVVNHNIIFAPYAESARKPIYSAQVTVGSTTIAVTGEKVKLSLLMPRHMSKPQLIMFIEEEMKEVVRRIGTDVYDMLAMASNDNENCHPDGKVNVSVNVNVEKKGGAA